MKRYLTLLFVLSMVFGNQLIGQKALSKTKIQKYQKLPSHKKINGLIPAEPIICYGSDEISHHYVPPKPKSSLVKNKKNLQFNATYSPETPGGVKEIFDGFIFPTLSESFSSNIPINIQVNWEAQSGGTLASAGPTFYSRVLGLPLQDSWYPVALAEKLLDRNLNGDIADIQVTINSQAEWHFDYLNPAGIGNRFDLAGILLHEVYHGMGFTSFRTIDDNGDGFLLLGGFPFIFSRFVQNEPGVPLLNFQEGSDALANELTSNMVYFSSENLSNNERARLYAPAIFEPGGSIAHLNEVTYNNTMSSLMTPNAGRGEVERAAGISETLMKDMGWTNTSIIHTPPPAVENVDISAKIEAYIVSDVTVDESSLKLIFFEEGSNSPNELSLNKGNDGIFSAEIPATGEERFVLYYLTLNDASGNTFTNPGEAPNKLLYRYNFAIDREAPVVIHDPVAQISTVDNSFSIVAEVTDEFIGVESVVVETSINKGAIFTTETTFEPLNEFTDSLYLATIQLPDGPLLASDILEYRIVAVDGAVAMNRGKSPENGFHKIEISAVGNTINQYFADFSESADDFFSDGFEIATPSGFTDPAVHSLHPYLNAGENSTIDYTYQLKFPIRINADDPTIKFDEIVLVENGDPGAAFGTLEFWDYVIVEGQRLGERDWLPFLEGYDCRDNAIWRSTYINGIPTNGQDSEGVGTSQMFRPREIDMTANENFSPEEEIFIRFRLFSDPFAVGWGWAIDNLRIQASVVAVDDYVEEKNSFVVYPNPVQDEMYLGINLKQNAPNSQITLTDIYGKVIHNQRIDLNADYNEETINTSNLPQGMYLVSVRFNNEDIITKKVIK